MVEIIELIPGIYNWLILFLTLTGICFFSILILNLTQLTGTHTLTLQGSASVQEVKYTVSDDQSASINTIKSQTTATINLTLKLTEVTLKIKSGNGDTLTASGTITTTKTVNSPGSNLNNEHQLNFTSINSLSQSLTASGGNVTIGPGSTHHRELTLTAQPAGENGKPTNLNLKLDAGTKSDGSGGEVPNDQLTLSKGNILQLEGGIEGTLTYSNGSIGNGNTFDPAKRIL